MDNSLDLDKCDNDISTALREFQNLHFAHEEKKKGQKELSELVALLQEEVKLARDAERSADFKKSRCQAYVSQQQEVILKMLSVKEENESLKQKIHQMEITLSDIQNNSIAEHVKKEAEIQEIKQDYLKEFIKVQEAATSQVTRVKDELSSNLEELKSIISKNQETIKKQENIIDALQSEIEDLKERASINVNLYQKKLADQERNYQAELETWKMAELNRSTLEKQTQNTNMVPQYGSKHCPGSSNPYQPGKQVRQTPEYSHSLSMQNTANNQLNSYSNITNSYLPHPQAQPLYKNQPLISRSKNVSRILPNNVRRSTSLTSRNIQKQDILSANEFYLQNQEKKNNYGEENEEEEFSNRSVDTVNSNDTVIETSKVAAPKRRKLFNSDDIFL